MTRSRGSETGHVAKLATWKVGNSVFFAMVRRSPMNLMNGNARRPKNENEPPSTFLKPGVLPLFFAHIHLHQKTKRIDTCGPSSLWKGH